MTKAVFGEGTSEGQLTVTGTGHVIEGGVWSRIVVVTDEEFECGSVDGSGVPELAEAALETEGHALMLTIPLMSRVNVPLTPIVPSV
jgi:hypothetical protein